MIKKLKEHIGIYVTFNGLPMFSLTNKPEDDKSILMSSFLHTIDIIARETRKNIGRSTDFYGFAFVNEIEISVMEVLDKKGDSTRNKIRIFIESPYGKIPSNKSPIAALLGTTQEIVSKITDKELNLITQPKETAELFKERLKDRGYTPDKVLTELGILKLSKALFLGFIPISLFSIEKEEKKEGKYKVEEIGSYNDNKYKNNPVKDEAGKLTFEPGFIIGLAEALKSYQQATKVVKRAIILRFKDYTLEFSYKKDGLPIIGVLVKGKGTPEEVRRYRKDIRKLES